MQTEYINKMFNFTPPHTQKNIVNGGKVDNRR